MKSLDGIIRINKKPKVKKENFKFSDKNSVSDPTKRKFIKLAGIAGVGALAYSLIPKQAQGLVFGSSMRTDSVKIKNSEGVEINPATDIKQDELIASQKEFKVQAVDDYTTTDVTYVCKVKEDGEWQFMKIDDTGTFPTFTYASVENNATMTTYALAYADRATLNYDLYHEL